MPNIVYECALQEAHVKFVIVKLLCFVNLKARIHGHNVHKKPGSYYVSDHAPLCLSHQYSLSTFLKVPHFLTSAKTPAKYWMYKVL